VFIVDHPKVERISAAPVRCLVLRGSSTPFSRPLPYLPFPASFSLRGLTPSLERFAPAVPFASHRCLRDFQREIPCVGGHRGRFSKICGMDLLRRHMLLHCEGHRPARELLWATRTIPNAWLSQNWQAFAVNSGRHDAPEVAWRSTRTTAPAFTCCIKSNGPLQMENGNALPADSPP